MTKKFKVTDGTTVIGPYEEHDAVCSLITQLTGGIVTGQISAKWHIEEYDGPEKPKNVPELIPDYDTATQYLGCFDDTREWQFNETAVSRWVYPQTVAFHQLLTLAKAWNKADNWAPDWNDEKQAKWAFHYDRKGNVIAEMNATFFGYYHVPFVFATEKRAAQFGERFKDLFKQLYGIKEGE